MQRFQALSPSFASVSLKKGIVKSQLVAAYFPCSGYSDPRVQRMYDMIHELHRERAPRHDITRYSQGILTHRWGLP
eukprot:2471631-Pyramimonas_sp.AAC.1